MWSSHIIKYGLFGASFPHKWLSWFECGLHRGQPRPSLPLTSRVAQPVYSLFCTTTAHTQLPRVGFAAELRACIPVPLYRSASVHRHMPNSIHACSCSRPSCPAPASVHPPGSRAPARRDSLPAVLPLAAPTFNHCPSVCSSYSSNNDLLRSSSRSSRCHHNHHQWPPHHSRRQWPAISSLTGNASTFHMFNSLSVTTAGRSSPSRRECTTIYHGACERLRPRVPGCSALPYVFTLAVQSSSREHCHEDPCVISGIMLPDRRFAATEPCQEVGDNTPSSTTSSCTPPPSCACLILKTPQEVSVRAWDQAGHLRNRRQKVTV
jgi:hypothetical protein